MDLFFNMVRPKLTSSNSIPVSSRITVKLAGKLSEYCELEKINTSEVIRQILTRFLDNQNLALLRKRELPKKITTIGWCNNMDCKTQFNDRPSRVYLSKEDGEYHCSICHSSEVTPND